MRQRRKWRAFCLGVTGSVSPPIGEALALDALGGDGGMFEIGHMAGVVPEIELAEVALKVFGRNPLVVAVDAALEDREIVFDRVRVEELASDIFLDRVVDCAVA